MGEVELCGCHGEPAYWQKDRRLRTGGWWECRVKRGIRNAARQGDRKILDRRIELWHQADGGYIRSRRRKLASQRNRIIEQLEQLDQEAADAQP